VLGSPAQVLTLRCLSVAAQMKPTLLIGVPRVFDRIYAGVYSKMNASPIKKFLFNFGYRWKLYYMNQGYAFNKVICSMSHCVPVQTCYHGKLSCSL